MEKLSKNILFSVDDVHPEHGWCDGHDQQTQYIDLLHDEFGVKFTFFVPANYHYKAPVGSNPDFFLHWDSKNWIELAAHGYAHLVAGTNDEREFFKMFDTPEIRNSFDKILYEWAQLGFRPAGFKTPGWLISNQALQWAEHFFQYVVSHPQYRKDHIINPLTEILHKDNDQLVILHAHANGPNENNITPENYQGWRQSLQILTDRFDCNFMTFNEYHKEVHIEN